MSTFSPQSQSIETILSASTSYRIPIYQRDYRWGEAEARELIEDLRAHEGVQNNPLFLGTFIFQPDPPNQATLVIDGQQRLTTLYILLIAIRTQAFKLNNIKLGTRIQEKITLIDSTTAESRDARIIASDSIRLIFEHMAKEDWDGEFPDKLRGQSVKRQINRVRPIYEVFLEEVSQLKTSDDLSRLLRAVYSSFVISVSIVSEDQALSIFERTNARGMNLEISDLLKHHLFSNRIASIDQKWAEIVENSDATIVRLLKYFYVSRKGYTRKPQLYRGLKSLVDELQPADFVDELLQFSKFYYLTKNPSTEAVSKFFDEIGLKRLASSQEFSSEVSRSLAALREFGIVQYVPLAYAFVRLARRYILADSGNVQREQAAAKQLVEIFVAFERYHFINNVICERVGNEIERLYAETCVKIEQEIDLQIAAKELLQALRDKRASFEEFLTRFVEITYSQGELATILYIFDRLNNRNLKEGQRLNLFVADRRLRSKSHNIEHFYPQSPRDQDRDEGTWARRHNIGNLLPLYFRDNSSLGNAPPGEKAALLRGEMQEQIQNLPFVQRFLSEFCPVGGFIWDVDTIDRRAKILAKEVFEVVGKY